MVLVVRFVLGTNVKAHSSNSAPVREAILSLFNLVDASKDDRNGDAVQWSTDRKWGDVW